MGVHSRMKAQAMSDSIPSAYVRHAIAGRVRFRVPSRKYDDAYFDRVAAELSSWEAVDEVRTNATTTGILLRHSSSLQVLVERAREANLFAMISSPVSSASLLDQVSDRLEEADERVRAATGGTYDLESTAFVGLVGLGLLQIIRGKHLGPASSLLWSAASLVLGRRVLEEDNPSEANE